MNRWVSAIGLSTLLSVEFGGAAAQELKVGISEQLAFIDVVHDGKRVRIQRIQDTSHRVTDAWARTSRPCPPSCIQPMSSAAGVTTVGELELLDFLAGQGRGGSGLLVDTRPPEAYRAETIPGAVSLPFSIVRPENPHLGEVLLALGARQRGAQWNFDSAKELMLFCAGAWSDQSSRAVRALLSLGYPPGRLRYYRGGLQSWRLMGLTTVSADSAR